MSPAVLCGNCGHTLGQHYDNNNRCAGIECTCDGFRQHTAEDFPSAQCSCDNRLKIAALCGVLEFQLDSIRFEVSRKSALVDTYIDDAEKTLSELRTLALARE